jgi:hypothetical protein
MWHQITWFFVHVSLSWLIQVDHVILIIIIQKVMFEFGWLFGLWGCTAYVIGIAQASAEVCLTFEIKKKEWDRTMKK